MKQCQFCRASLLPLARFCGQCGQETGFDLPVLKEGAGKSRLEKTETSGKRKALAGLSLFLFILIFIFIGLFIVISFSLNYYLAGIFFTLSGLAFIFYFLARAKPLKNLVRRELDHHCSYCGTRFLKEEKYCQQCGKKL